DGETTIELPGITDPFARSSTTAEGVVAKRSILIIVDNAVRLSDRHLPDLTKALSTVSTLERIDLMLPCGQDPASFLEGGFPSPCFRCSAKKDNRAFEGERDNAEDTYVVDSYHIENEDSVAVTARIVFQRENYGSKFVGVLMDRTCCESKPTLRGVNGPKIRGNSTPNLDTINFLPRVDVDACMLVSKGWRATIARHNKSLTLHPLAQFTIYGNGSSRCAYKMSDGRIAFRASATAMLDALRNSHIEHLHVEFDEDNFLVDMPLLIVDANVTSAETTLTLPTFLSTYGTRATHRSPAVIGEMIKQLRSEELALTFDAEERDFKSMDRTCCESKPTLRGAIEPRIRQISTPNLDAFNFLPRVDVDSCVLVSNGWRATIAGYSKSITLRPLAQFTIYGNGSSGCAYKLPDGRVAFRASATTMLDALRNSHIEHLHVEFDEDNFLVDLLMFIANANVTSAETTLTLPPAVIDEMIKQLRSVELALTFDAEERDFSVLRFEYFKHRLRALRIVIMNDHIPSFELGRLLFSQRSENIHLTLSTPTSAHFLATFLDDFLQQSVFEDLHQVTVLQVAVQTETAYDAPSLQFVKEVDLSENGLREQLPRYFLPQAMQCCVYELHRQKGDSYTVIISREPESPHTGGNRSLQVIVVPAKVNATMPRI
ncbi:hypothetical protein AAVH_33881, partial [Aphelenchoides avenae]